MTFAEGFAEANVAKPEAIAEHLYAVVGSSLRALSIVISSAALFLLFF
jgi:hypothetical protein